MPVPVFAHARAPPYPVPSAQQKIPHFRHFSSSSFLRGAYLRPIPTTPYASPTVHARCAVPCGLPPVRRYRDDGWAGRSDQHLDGRGSTAFLVPTVCAIRTLYLAQHTRTHTLPLQPGAGHRAAPQQHRCSGTGAGDTTRLTCLYSGGNDADDRKLTRCQHACVDDVAGAIGASDAIATSPHLPSIFFVTR